MVSYCFRCKQCETTFFQDRSEIKVGLYDEPYALFCPECGSMCTYLAMLDGSSTNFRIKSLKPGAIKSLEKTVTFHCNNPDCCVNEFVTLKEECNRSTERHYEFLSWGNMHLTSSYDTYISECPVCKTEAKRTFLGGK